MQLPATAWDRAHEDPATSGDGPLTDRAESLAHPDLRDVRRRLSIAVLLTVPLIALQLASHFAPFPIPISRGASNWLGCALATPVVFWSGWRLFAQAAEGLKARAVSSLRLAAIRTGGAWAYSVIASLVPSIFPAWMQSADGTLAVYFDAAAAMTVFVLLGQMLELKRARVASPGAACCDRGSSPRPAACCA